MIGFAKKVVRRILNALPEYPVFDRIEALATFWVAHRRLPRHGSGLFNDRLYFFKTNPAWTEDPLRCLCSDKHLAKYYIRGALGWDAAPRTVALIDCPEDVTEAAFPAPSIIKPTHLQGEFIHHDGSAPLGEARLARIRGWFDQRIYRSRSRERNYRSLRPKVIAEELVGDPGTISDWRVFCWHGKARAVLQVDARDDGSDFVRSLFTRDWEFLDIQYNSPVHARQPRPARLDAILETAEKLAIGFDFIRVDIYATADRIYVGELTNIPNSANGRFGSLAQERLLHDLVFGQESKAREPESPG